MKKITMLAVIPLLMLVTIHAWAAAPLEASGTATFTLTAYAQKYLDMTVSIKTHYTSTTTNVTTVTKSKATNTPIDSAVILGLLENSFKTNFPSGAELIMSGVENYSFLVVDSTGTNVLLDASTVLSIAANVSVDSGRETLIQKTSHTGTKDSGNNTERIIEYATLSYDDNALTTKDGTHTNFQLSGILVDMLSENIGTDRATQSVTLRGAGTGTIQGKSNIILKGTVTAALAGVLVG